VAWVLGLEKLLGDRPFFELPPEPAEADEPDDELTGEQPLDFVAMRNAGGCA
jgi:hypothetical protein